MDPSCLRALREAHSAPRIEAEQNNRPPPFPKNPKHMRTQTSLRMPGSTLRP